MSDRVCARGAGCGTVAVSFQVVADTTVRRGGCIRRHPPRYPSSAQVRVLTLLGVPSKRNNSQI
jgi:hypothetical protein